MRAALDLQFDDISKNKFDIYLASLKFVLFFLSNGGGESNLIVISEIYLELTKILLVPLIITQEDTYFSTIQTRLIPFEDV